MNSMKEENQKEYLASLRAWLEETKDTKLEEMAQFFTKRLGGYEEHMFTWKDHYHWMAQVVPERSNTLLDMGCVF